MNNKRGRLVVFEGTDGSGKTTQAKLLLNYLKKNKIPNAYISFPRYESSMWGKMVRRFLDGDFGQGVDPYLASMLYAGDRAAASETINKWIGEGKIVVCNRYVASNIGHMGAKFVDTKKRKEYILWLTELEYKENAIPKEDLVFLLQVPIKTTKELMKNRKLDIHEKDLTYQKKVFDVYDSFAGRKKNWVKVECTKDGEILSPEEIHSKIVEVFNRRK